MSAAQRAEVLRVLGRYLTEVIEPYNLCPWAKSARLRGEVGIAVLPHDRLVPEACVAAATELFASGKVKVGMITFPRLADDPRAFHRAREPLNALLPAYGIAEFHPTATPNTVRPEALVPFLRRSPDPLLQLVPHAILDGVRHTAPAMTIAMQQAAMRGELPPPEPDIAERIALDNLATLQKVGIANVGALLDDILADRDRAYAAVGLDAPVRSAPAPA